MHIVFVKNYDIYAAGKGYTLERTLGARLCKMGVAIPYSVHVDNQAKAKREKAEAAAKAETEKIKSLKQKEDVPQEMAESKTVKKRSRATRKSKK
jgi:hypothetical protein